jgi:hypothetical protein
MYPPPRQDLAGFFLHPESHNLKSSGVASYKFLPYGTGKRMCVGSGLGRVVMFLKVLIIVLLIILMVTMIVMLIMVLMITIRVVVVWWWWWWCYCYCYHYYLHPLSRCSIPSYA